MEGGILRIVFPVAVLMSTWAASATAQLYRWVDPETGSVKLSSYPPPWYNDPARQRAPKVEVIAPTRRAPAFEPRLETDREPAAPASGDAPPGDRRAALVKSLGQRTAALISSAPEKMEGAYLELADSLRQLEDFDQKLRPADRRDEAARQEERRQFAAPLESRRTALLQQMSSLAPPPAGSPPDRVASAWSSTQRLLAELGWIDNAIVSFDRSKSNVRHFEMNALIDRLVAQWEAHVDPSVVRRSIGR